MATRNKQISQELGDQLRAVSFTSPKDPVEDLDLHMSETSLDPNEEVAPEMPKPLPKKSFSLNQRVVTVEYLDKFEQATTASAKYETVKEFSQTISNLSIALLSLSIIIYFIAYFINPLSLSFTSLLILALEAFGLLGLTLYSMTKASTYKQIRDIAISDFSTCSQAIGNPRAEAYIPIPTPEIPN